MSTRLLCWIGVHRWGDWKAHEQPCIAGPGLTHYIRQCPHCTARDHRFMGGCVCPTDPNEYMHCPRWIREDPACRSKEK